MNRQNNAAENAGTILNAVVFPCHGGDGAGYSHQTCISGSTPPKAMSLSTQPKSKSWQQTLLGLQSREGLNSKVLLTLPKLINYAMFDDVVTLVLRTLMDLSRPWHCCLQIRISETERDGELHLLI